MTAAVPAVIPAVLTLFCTAAGPANTTKPTAFCQYQNDRGEITTDPINITKLTSLGQYICQLKQNGKFLGSDTILDLAQKKL